MVFARSEFLNLRTKIMGHSRESSISGDLPLSRPFCIIFSQYFIAKTRLDQAYFPLFVASPRARIVRTLITREKWGKAITKARS